MFAHRTHLRSARPAGQEQDHRVVGAMTTDHHRQFVSVAFDGRQFRHRTGDCLAGGVDDCVGTGGSSKHCGEPNEADRSKTSDAPPDVHPHTRGGDGASGLLSGPTRNSSPDERSKHHRKQRQRCVEPAPRSECNQPVLAGGDSINQGTIRSPPDEFEGTGEHDRHHQRRPA
jgi:hypothetical protein